MPSVHFKRWILNIDQSNFELFWFDILNRGTQDFGCNINQIVDWQKRKVPYIPGEYRLESTCEKFYKIIEPLLKTTASEYLSKIIKNIKPDIVHSFELFSSAYPVLKSMRTHENLPWIYSCWGSDIFYFKDKKSYKNKIIKVLRRVDIIHTDNIRDQKLIKSLNFKGCFSKVIPGGGGYDTKQMLPFKEQYPKRNIILVKGYENKFGKGLNVIKALQELELEKKYKIVIFSANKSISDYVNSQKLPYEIIGNGKLNNFEVLKLMGKSFMYVGNSISDGIPNTLLETMLMGAFPINSNPGNVTEEIIKHGENGILISNPNKASSVVNAIKKALLLKDEFHKVDKMNEKLMISLLEYNKVKRHIGMLYSLTDEVVK